MPKTRARVAVLLFLAVTVASMTLLVNLAEAAPPGPGASKRTAIAVSLDTPAAEEDTTNFTRNTGGRCQKSYNVVWFKYTASQSGTLVADTIGTYNASGSTLDTVLHVYEENRLIGCDDDSGSNHGGGSRDSWLQFEATAGLTYYFAVGGFDEFDFGDIIFNLTD